MAMAGNEKPKKMKRRLLGVAFSLVSLAVLVYVTVALLSGRGLDFSRFSGLFAARAPALTVQEYHFEVGRGRVFADLGDAVASAGTLGVQVLGGDGNETLRDTFRMFVPAISAVNGRAIAFDIGGTAVRVFDRSSIIASFDTAGMIVSASINRNGWFSVSTQESGGFGGSVTVYNSDGRSVYRFDSGVEESGYVLSAVLSPDNRNMAVLSLADSGSKITFFNLDTDLAVRSTDFPGMLIIDIHFLPNGHILAISADLLVIVDRSGASRALYDFFDKRLGGYIFGDGIIVLHLLDYGVGHGGRLVTLAEDGVIQGEVVTDREVISMSFGGGYLAVLRSDGLLFFDTLLDEFPAAGEFLSTVGMNRALALGDGLALVAGDHSAVVWRAAPGD
jgi:hypothetical protein